MQTHSSSTIVFLAFSIVCHAATIAQSQTNGLTTINPYDPSRLNLPALRAAADHTIHAHGKHGGGPIIPSNLWHSAISELDPIRVRNHRYNLAVVLKEDAVHEEGVYLRCSKSSFAVFFPLGTNVSSQAADGYRFTRKMNVVTFVRAKPKKGSQQNIRQVSPEAAPSASPDEPSM